MAPPQETLQAILDRLTADTKKVPGAICYVANKKGETVFHGASGLVAADKPEKLTTDHLAQFMSATKLLTCLSVMQLVESGKVDLDEPAAKYEPRLADLKVLDNGKLRPPKTQPTVKQCITHTCGAGYPLLDPTLFEWCTTNGVPPFETSHRAVLEAPLMADPGTEWRYGYGVDYAGLVVEAVSGMDLDAYMKKHLFAPLGIKDITFRPKTDGLEGRLMPMHLKHDGGPATVVPYYLPLDDTQQELFLGGAGAIGSARDYCQVLVALLNNGTHPINKGQILRPESVRQFLSPALDDSHQVKDLDRPIPGANPDLTNVWILLEGHEKQWSYAGCLSPKGVANGRSSQGVWWAGLNNSYWFLDPADGTCGMLQCSQFPFFDADIYGAWMLQIEALVHQSAKNGFK